MFVQRLPFFCIILVMTTHDIRLTFSGIVSIDKCWFLNPTILKKIQKNDHNSDIQRRFLLKINGKVMQSYSSLYGLTLFETRWTMSLKNNGLRHFFIIHFQNVFRKSNGMCCLFYILIYFLFPISDVVPRSSRN